MNSSAKFYKIIFVLTVILLLLLGLIFLLFSGRSTGVTDNYYNSLSNDIPATTLLDIKGCFDKAETEFQKCLDGFLADYGKDKAVSELLRELETARLQDNSIDTQCHPLSHAIGRFALSKHENVGDAFEQCDFTCQSGCYHGVMERLFFTSEEIAAGIRHLTYDDFKTRLPGICDASKFSNPNSTVIFNCLHGAGHAVMYSINYKLQPALDSCDLFETEYERLACYGGVFMENITAFDKSKRDLKPDDPNYPCNFVDVKYRQSCYELQTSAMMEYGLEWDTISDICNDLPQFNVACFRSFGRDLSNFVRNGRNSEVARVCQKHGKIYAESCIEGAVKATIDVYPDLKISSPFCNSVEEQNLDYCYGVSTSYLSGVYSIPKDQIQQNCRDYAGTNSQRCLNSITF